MSKLLLVKLQPNQDLHEGLEAACTMKGVQAGLIISGVGSLNEAVFERATDTGQTAMQSIVGPGVEIAGLSGELRIDTGGAGTSVLTGWITRTDGTVVGGALVRGRNRVCITFEVTILEWSRVNCPPEAPPSPAEGRIVE